MSNILKILYKNVSNFVEIKNVVQLDLSNIGEDEFEEDWNFINIITKENGKIKKLVIPLKIIQQFLLVSDRGVYETTRIK